MPNNSQLVLVPFGAWFSLGAGPMKVRLATVGNNIRITQSAETPVEPYTNQVNLLTPDNSEIVESLDTPVWVQLTATTNNGIQCAVSVTAIGGEEEDVPSPPSAVPDTGAVTAFTTGESIGGVLDFEGVTSGTAETATLLRSITMVIPAVVDAEFKLYLFSQNPTNSAITNGAAVVINPLDAQYLIGEFTLQTPDTSLGASLYQLANINQALSGSPGTYYGVLVPQAAVTLTPSETPNVPILTVSLGVA